MSFQEADEFNAINGNQFIADLMPKTPIYTAMLTDHARSVIGLPHPNGRAAMRMLEAEGFVNAGYVDIFDGGPTMLGDIDNLRTVKTARDVRFAGVHDERGQRMLVASGQLADYRCAYGIVVEQPDGAIALDETSARVLNLSSGDALVVAER
jgi:arginine N-succinyltransferase